MIKKKKVIISSAIGVILLSTCVGMYYKQGDNNQSSVELSNAEGDHQSISSKSKSENKSVYEVEKTIEINNNEYKSSPVIYNYKKSEAVKKDFNQLKDTDAIITIDNHVITKKDVMNQLYTKYFDNEMYEFIVYSYYMINFDNEYNLKTIIQNDNKNSFLSAKEIAENEVIANYNSSYNFTRAQKTRVLRDLHLLGDTEEYETESLENVAIKYLVKKEIYNEIVSDIGLQSADSGNKITIQRDFEKYYSNLISYLQLDDSLGYTLFDSNYINEDKTTPILKYGKAEITIGDYEDYLVEEYANSAILDLVKYYSYISEFKYTNDFINKSPIDVSKWIPKSLNTEIYTSDGSEKYKHLENFYKVNELAKKSIILNSLNFNPSTIEEYYNQHYSKQIPLQNMKNEIKIKLFNENTHLYPIDLYISKIVKAHIKNYNDKTIENVVKENLINK